MDVLGQFQAVGVAGLQQLVVRVARLQELVVGVVVPQPVAVGAAVVLGTALWLVSMYVLFRLAFRLWRRVKPRVVWAVGLVTPESPVVKFAIGLMVLVGFTIGLVGVLPGLLGGLSNADDGPAGYVNRMSDTALDGDWNAIVDGDAAGGEPGCRASRPDGAVDGDGDGLPDAWERAGETPDGAGLPGASPTHKDLFVQVDRKSVV